MNQVQVLEKMLKDILRWSSRATESHTELIANEHITPKAGSLGEIASL